MKYLKASSTCCSWPNPAEIAAALIAGGVTAFALRSRGSSSQGGTPPEAGPAPRSGPPLLPRPLTPKGLLPQGAPRKSKTQRMRENTAAAARSAERSIGRAAQAEITRAGAVANAMAASGEATGMAAKTGFREVRLRAEALRRRFEPGYRPADAPKPPKQLTEGGPAVQIPFYPAAPLTPERVQVDPRTGQPRRRKARGFGRGDAASHQLIGTHYVDPAAQRGDGRSTDYYRSHPEARAKKVATQAAINRRPEERKRRAELNRERRRPRGQHNHPSS